MNTVGEYYFVVPEHVVREGAKHCSDDEKNSFDKVLKAADEFKAAEMTPIFLLSRSFTDLRVVAEETFMKKLH